MKTEGKRNVKKKRKGKKKRKEKGKEIVRLFVESMDDGT